MQVHKAMRRKSASRNPVARVDTSVVKLRTPTLDLVATAYAEAVAIGDLDAAEGWFATARYVAERDADRQSSRRATRPITRPRRLSLR